MTRVDAALYTGECSFVKRDLLFSEYQGPESVFAACTEPLAGKGRGADNRAKNPGEA